MAQYDLDTLGKIESNVSSLALELRLYFHEPEEYDDLGSIASCADRICELASPAHADLLAEVATLRQRLAAAEAACIEIDKFTTAHIINFRAVTTRDEFENVLRMIRQTARAARRCDGGGEGMMAHTEGPVTVFKIEPSGDYAITAVIDGKRAIIGKAYRQVSDGECTAVGDNARLWASAPALLAEVAALHAHHDGLAAQLDRVTQLAESRRVGWEGAIAIQGALESQRDELAAACELALAWYDKPSDTAHLQIRQWIEQMRAALARLEAEQ